MLKQKPEDLLNFIIGDGFSTGFFSKLKDSVKMFVDPGYGTLNSRKKAIQSNIKRIDQNISSREKRLEQKEKMLKEKFGKLEETISKIKSQGSAMTSI